MSTIKWAFQYVGTDTHLTATMPSGGEYLPELTREYYVFLHPRKGGRVYQLLFNTPYSGGTRGKFEVLLEEGKVPLDSGYPDRLVTLAENILTQYIVQAYNELKDAERNGRLPWMADMDDSLG